MTISSQQFAAVEKAVTEVSQQKELLDGRLTYLVLDGRRRYVRKAESLAQACRELARDMERVALAADCLARFESASINSSGAVQGAGSSIDRKCAELQMLSDHIGEVEGALGVDYQALNLEFQAISEQRQTS